MDDRQKLALAVAVGGIVGACGGAALSAVLLKWREEGRILSRRNSITSVCDRCTSTPDSLSRLNHDATDHMVSAGDTISAAQLPELAQLLESNKQMSETLKMLELKISHMDSVLKSRTLSRSSSSLGGYATANESPDLSDEEFDLAVYREPGYVSQDELSGDEIYFHTQTHAKPKTAIPENGGILKGAMVADRLLLTLIVGMTVNDIYFLL